MKSAKQKSTRARRKVGTSANSKRRLMLETLESRQLLAAGFSPGGVISGMRNATMARNVGTVPAFTVIENERVGIVGVNDTKATAQHLPLGTLPTQRDTIDLNGSISLVDVFQRVPEDIDWYSFDLRAGDILDISLSGGAGEFDVYFERALPYNRGDYWFSGISNFTGGSQLTTPYPFESPLQTQGTVLGAQVVPYTGRYFLRISSGGFSGPYTVGLRAYRPVLESQPIGTMQTLFLDFDGAAIPRSEITPINFEEDNLPVFGTARLSPLSEFIEGWGMRPQDEDRLVDLIVDKVRQRFAELGINANNGDFDSTGNPGDFGIRILNSRDHADPWGQPHVSRVVIGGTQEEAGFDEILGDDIIGIASSTDVGNFATSQTAIILLDEIEDILDDFPIAGGVSLVELYSTYLGNIASREAGTFFGAWRTNNGNNRFNIMDAVGNDAEMAELGLDGIFGTIDDLPTRFIWDSFSPGDAIMFGIQDTPNTLAFGLSTGTVGTPVTGLVFDDLNGNGQRGANEPGLAGVTVFNDTNNNGILDPNEQFTVTGSDGSFTLNVPPGQARIRTVRPDNYLPTTAESFVVTAGQATNVVFGYNRFQADVTGFVFADINGNRVRDPGEPGIEGVYVYIDLDGDGRPDIGEPFAISGPDGSYDLNFPGPGTYTIRQVSEPGFVQTFPTAETNFAHTVVFDGVALSGNFNFASQPSRNWGNAPEGYPVTAAQNGPNHAIVPGLSLGQQVLATADGVPGSTDSPDVDGVRVSAVTSEILSPGRTGILEVTVTNTTGLPAYVQGWIDFNRDFSFSGSGEHVIVNRQLAPGTHQIPVTVPADVTPGPVVGRFRISNTQNLTPTGPANSGEVEDHIFQVFPTQSLANPDTFSVPRNSVGRELDVLANDFAAPGTNLQIDRLIMPTSARSVVTISEDGRFLRYTPPNGFVGVDQFAYVVRNTVTGEEAVASVTVTVTFQTDRPIAVDNTFNVPEGSVNRPLLVLENDITSVNGGLRIASFAQGNRGGRVELAGGGQALLYTPAVGFRGTEQFNYTVVDNAGLSDSAQVTIKMSPGSALQDEVRFSFDIRDDNNRPIDNVGVGEEFFLSVFVQDVRQPLASRTGIASAFLDLLYTDALVTPVPDFDTSSGFPFQIDFGPLFVGSSDVFQQGDAVTPGLLNEIGGTQPVGNEVVHGGEPVRLFTVTMRAVSEGVARFQADPADTPVAETIHIGSDTPVPVQGLGLGSAELVIINQPGQIPTKAVDDSFPDSRDSMGNLIVHGQDAVLDVLRNDLLGPTGEIVEFGIVAAPTRGTVTVDDRGNPSNLNNARLIYRPDQMAPGVDRFTYFIVTADGFRSTAEVSVSVGAAAANAVAAMDFRVVDEAGNQINQVNVQDTFGVQVFVQDLRSSLQTSVQGIFAAYLDLLYDRTLVTPTNDNNSDFGFDVEFGPLFNEQAAVGSAAIPGIIDEFGSFQLDASGTADPLGGEPRLLATLFFRADAVGQARFVGDKADFSPFQDTLFFDPPGPVDPSLIRFDVAEVSIVIPQGESPLQNGINRFDVNGDGYVSPIDVLLIINTLNQEARTGAQGESRTGSTLFPDVDGDGRVTPFDALQIINHLGRQARSSLAQGEAVASAVVAPLVIDTPLQSSPETEFEAAVQQVYQHDEVAVGVLTEEDSTEAGSIANQAPTINKVADDDDEQSVDYLELLAGDVATVWK